MCGGTLGGEYGDQTSGDGNETDAGLVNTASGSGDAATSTAMSAAEVGDVALLLGSTEGSCRVQLIKSGNSMPVPLTANEKS